MVTTMMTLRTIVRARRDLYPFPNGWYALGFSDELGPGQRLFRQFMGQELVLFRRPAGQAVAANVGTRLRTWPLREQHGILLVYHHHAGRLPDWEIPAYDMGGWSRLYHGVLRAHTHPQETTENGVVLGHFAVVHGYEGVELLDVQMQGPYMRSSYVFHRSADFLGRGLRRLRVEFQAHIYGLGYSVVEASVPSFKLHTRQFVLATPTDGEVVELRLALSLKELERSSQIHALLGPFPPRLITRLIAWSTFKGFVRDVKQDFPIWEQKKYVHPPCLADGDGPIGRYRRWASQFYPEGQPLMHSRPASPASRALAAI